VLSGDGVDEALAEVIRRMPEGEPFFPADQFTDQPERFLAAEIIREKAIHITREEVPHAVAVLVDAFEESERLIRIRATIYAERDGQKGILIGKGGATMKEIGIQARLELEELLGTKIFLDLHVKVHRHWRDKPALLKQLDWRRQLERLAE
jgi:GTP-binding protein Era